MSITQRFYPRALFGWFLNAGPFSSDDLGCVASLYTSEADFSENDIFESTPTKNLASYKLAGSDKAITVTLDCIGPKLYFNIPEIYWDTPPGTSFRHIIIKFVPSGAILFMHIDLGEDLNPTQGFRLVQSEVCSPHIDFTPITCGGITPPPETIIYAGAGIDVKSGDFSLLEAP